MFGGAGWVSRHNVRVSCIFVVGFVIFWVVVGGVAEVDEAME